MTEKRTKEHIGSFDFIRLTCAVGIIVYHYSCGSAGPFRPLFIHANGNWGDAIVSAFLSLSGAVLVYNYSEIDSLKRFWYRRMKSVLPAFYIAFAILYVKNVFAYKKLFFSGSPVKLLPSLVCMDGYLNYRIPGNYYLTGEWFLGAIVLCYLLYPLILKLFNRSAAAVTAVLLCADLAVIHTDYFVIEDIRNLFTVLFVFELGMLLMRYRKAVLDRPAAAAVCAVFAIFLIFFKLPLSQTSAAHALGLCLFVLLYHAGNLLMKNKTAASVIGSVERGGLSYPVFLLQHPIINTVLGFKDPSEPWKVCVMIAVTVVIVFLCAKALLAVTQAALNSRIYKKFEARILA